MSICKQTRGDGAISRSGQQFMNCEHCGKEMYNTPVDGWFHKREQDAIDCFWWQKLTDKNSFLSYGNPRHTPKKYKASVLVKIKDKNGVVS
jgi:hypothetical protein